jgi:hypothetical protein
MSPLPWANWAKTCDARVALSYLGHPQARTTAPMDTPIAVSLAAVLLTALGIDALIYGSEHLIFLTKKFVDLIEWVAFWR